MKRYLSFALFFLTPLQAQHKKPKLTVVIVIDQFAHRYLNKIKPYVKHGFKTFFDQGLNFENAYFPHGMPATATGHSALSTGALAKDHGIIGNRWFDRDGNKVYCDTDSPENAAEFNPHGGLYDYGRSSKLLLVDSVSDQYMLHRDPEKPHSVYALSLKGRAAIACASKLGKAIWFDNQTGLFTSSKAYFDSLPEWVTKFNNEYDINKKSAITWHLALPYNQAAYRFANPDTYQFTHSAGPLIHARFPVGSHNPGGYKGDRAYSLFAQSPDANQYLLDLSHACINAHLTKKDTKQMLLWISLSPLDKLGHDYGPDSKESFDMLYHLDKQLGDFMTKVQKQFGKNNVLFALTADHGSSPIIELMEEIGYRNARRFLTPDIMRDMNAFASQKYGIDAIAHGFKAPQFYLNENILDTLKDDVREALMNDLVAFLRKQPAIKNVWTFDQLHNSCFKKDQPENLLKQQLYRGRSGQLTIQTHPYAMITKWRKGTDHRSPYEYNLHVPLFFYYPGTIKKGKVKQKIRMTQFANTLAAILGVHKPSASIEPVLPCVVDQCCCP